MTPTNNFQNKRGFALLITLLVVSVIVAVTLSIVELSLQQLKLSVDSRDSEIAFQAANAGLECARYWRRMASTSFETGANVLFNCFGDSQSVAHNLAGIPVSGGGSAYRYQVNLDWGTGIDARCSVINIVSMVADTTNVTIGNATSPLRNFFSGYVNNTKVCTIGGRCTIAAVTGYSSACGQIGVDGTLKREILLEF